ncbi:4a-hydroxytetrahydrobiopterin dehydratase [Sphingomicrobium marinum]|uniref:4a-hydroxytetrahydrobiopterin dehydratase n=1 Tax=Sphingomicrobium marinum TaxID=1227950 RepID=UPI00223F3A42|nr:4a-hydroxytetrahydrobiopterin dehydratase [Sphingomicrobium marinum]
MDIPAGWTKSEDGKAIVRRFEFADFSEAFAFLTRVAIAAEKADHHPEIENVWNKVTLTLTTHDSGGLTDKDASLAATIDGLVA